MKVIDTHFDGLKIILPTVYEDERGSFFESFNERRYKKENLQTDFVQDNEAYSTYGVIRGLHFQKDRYMQGKLIRVIRGEVLDAALDLRAGSKSYGKVFTVILNDISKKQLYIPEGFAHGYAVLSKYAIFSYKCTSYYEPSSEGGIHPLDPKLNINWLIPKEKQIIGKKDSNLPTFNYGEDLL